MELIDYPALFELLALPLPDGRAGILEKLVQERFITEAGPDRFHITNLGAMLFAKRLADFDTLSRKAVRAILYKGRNRVQTVWSSASPASIPSRSCLRPWPCHGWRSPTASAPATSTPACGGFPCYWRMTPTRLPPCHWS